MVPRLFRGEIALVLLVCLCMVALPGCWNRRELETLAFVSAAGVDYNEATGFYELTVHVIKPRAGTEGNMTEKAYVQALSTGKTIFEAVRNSIQQLPARLFWAHNNVLIIGEETARRGVAELIDFFERDGETRHDVMIVVAEGCTANHMLKAAYELDDQPGMQMVEHIRFVRGSLSTTLAIDLHEFLIRLNSPGTAALAVRMKPMYKQPIDLPGELIREDIGLTPIVGGLAVFRNNRMVGWLEPLAARGLLWLTGETRGGLMVVEDPWNAGVEMGLELSQSSVEAKFSQVAGGRIKASVDIKATAYLGDVQGPISPLETADFPARLQERFEAQIRAEVNTALLECKDEMRSDVFGWGSALHRQIPELWSQVKDAWDEVFPEVEVEVAVRGRVLRSGTNLSSLRAK